MSVDMDVHESEPSVLFVGINYAPEPTGISPYTTGMAEGLAAQGWQPRVLTSYPHYPWWEIPAEFQDLPKDSMVNGVHVTRLRHYVPRRPGTITRALFEINFGVRAITSRWGKPDVVVVVSPALLASRIVALRARIQRVPVITWVQDIYTLGVDQAGAGGGARLVSAVERGLANGSDRVVVIHERFRRMFAEDLGVRRPINVVRNWSHVPMLDSSHRAETRAQLGWADDEIIVLHAGAIGAKQGLENVVEAARIATTRGSKVRFILLGDGSQREMLEGMGADPSLTFIDPLPDEAFFRALTAADALLVNERSGLTEMSVPSKLTTYFATGLPVIAAVDSTSTTHGEMSAAGAGPIVPAGDPAALLAAAEALGADGALSTAYGTSGRRYRDRVLTETAAIEMFREAVLRTLGARVRVLQPAG